MKSYRTFLITFLFIILTGLGSVTVFNFFMDPLWTFGHSHAYNDVQTVIDERQQKMNQIHFNEFEYDTLLVGSSRTTYINQHDFTGMNVYNFSASDLSFQEYKSFIDYAKKEKGSDFETIIIGVDFFKSSIHQSRESTNLKEYQANLQEPFYRFKNLLSIDILTYSNDNFQLSRNNHIEDLRNYNRKNTAYAKEMDEATKRKLTEQKVKKFKRAFYGEKYQYNPKFKETLQQLKVDNPNTTFMLFTTPISAPLFESLVEEGNFNDYQRWLSDMVAVFDGVYNFMYPNTITKDITNYFDGHHFYPNVGQLIAYRIAGHQPSVIPQDFGVYVTDENFKVHMKEVKNLVRKE